MYILSSYFSNPVASVSQQTDATPPRASRARAPLPGGPGLREIHPDPCGGSRGGGGGHTSLPRSLDGHPDSQCRQQQQRQQQQQRRRRRQQQQQQQQQQERGRRTEDRTDDIGPRTPDRGQRTGVPLQLLRSAKPAPPRNGRTTSPCALACWRSAGCSRPARQRQEAGPSASTGRATPRRATPRHATPHHTSPHHTTPHHTVL